LQVPHLAHLQKKLTFFVEEDKYKSIVNQQYHKEQLVVIAIRNELEKVLNPRNPSPPPTTRTHDFQPQKKHRISWEPQKTNQNSLKLSNSNTLETLPSIGSLTTYDS
jgi:hypothetical protein